TDFKNNAGRKTLPHTGKNCAEPLPGRIAPGLRPFFSGILPIVFHQIESLSRTIRHGYRSSRLRHAKMWLGAESNRRHVDFQSTALPTELPSRKIDNRSSAKAGRSLCKIHAAGQQRSKYSVPLPLLIVLCSGQNRLTLACMSDQFLSELNLWCLSRQEAIAATGN